MKSSLLKISDFFIENSFYALFVLVPLILTPLNSELFEFNKMMLTYALTVIIVTAWLVRMVLQGRIEIRRTPLDIPLLLFLLSQIVSTILSIDRHTSLWGYYSRFNQGLFSTIAYVLLFYALVSFATKNFVLNCLKWSLFSAFLISFYGILEHFGIDAKYWIQDVQNRVFSTIGQPNWLAAYLTALIPLTWALGLNSKLKTQNSKQYLCYLLFVISYLCLLYTNSRSGLVAFVAAYSVFWSLTFWFGRANLKIIKKPFIIITSSILLITLFTGSPWTSSIRNFQFNQPSTFDYQPSTIYYGGTESGDIRKIVWKGAIEVFKHYPVFGSGVETFAYSYYNFRPREHNDVSEWDFLYNKAHNEYLNFAATTGLVGLGSYLLIIIVFILWSLKEIRIQKTENRSLISAFLAGYVSILITNFFGFSVVPVVLFFFLLPAFAFVLSETIKKSYIINFPKKFPVVGYKLLIAFVILSSCFTFLTIGKFWYADVLYSKGKKANKKADFQEAARYLQTAIALRDGEPVYHDEISDTYSNLSTLAFNTKEATATAEFKDSAIAESDKALSVSPRNLNFLKTRIKIYLTLAGQDKKYYLDALEYLGKSITLAPTDAKLVYNQAVIHFYLNQETTAIELLKKAVDLRPNYRDAHATLAILYRLNKDYDKAEEHLKYIIEKIDYKDQEVLDVLEAIQASRAAEKK